MATRRQWTEEERLDELLLRLQDTARKFVYGQRNNYKQLVLALQNHFCRVETTRAYKAKFSKRNKKPSETVEEYAADIKRLCDKAHGTRMGQLDRIYFADFWIDCLMIELASKWSM